MRDIPKKKSMILRRLALVAGIFVMWSPVFSHADTGEREAPAPPDRPEHELRLEVAPSTGYGRFAICDSLSRVRYGGLGAQARYRYKAFAAKLGGAVSAAHQHISDQSEDPEPSRAETRAVVDGVAQVGFDTRYVALMGGVGLVSNIRATDDDGDDAGGGVVPSGALRLGDARSLSLRLSLADMEPLALALVAMELNYQHRDALRVGFGGRIDAFTLNAMPAVRVELPVGPHWLGLSTGATASQGAVAWQLQLLFNLQLLAWTSP